MLILKYKKGLILERGLCYLLFLENTYFLPFVPIKLNSGYKKKVYWVSYTITGQVTSSEKKKKKSLHICHC